MKTDYAQLHARIRQDDCTAFKELFDILWKPLYVFAQSILMDEDNSKDIVQEVWIDYWNRHKSIEAHDIKAYLYQAVRNKVYKSLSNKKLNPDQIAVINDIPLDSEIAQQYDLENTQQKINNILKTLPDRCREIFILSRNEGMKNDDIATHYGISKRTIENQIATALKKLREGLACLF